MWRNNIVAFVTHFCVAAVLYGAFTYGGIQAMSPAVGNMVAALMTIAGLGTFVAVGRWELHNQRSYREDLWSVVSVAFFGLAVFLYLYIHLYVLLHGHLTSALFIPGFPNMAWLNFSDVMLGVWTFMQMSNHFWSVNVQLSMIVITSVIPSILMWLGLQWKRNASTR